MASWAALAARNAGMPEPPPPPNVVTRRAAAAALQQVEVAKFQPTGDAERIFLAAVDSIFAKWSLLRLAVEMGWGDGDGVQNAHYLKEETLDWLQKRKAASSEIIDLEELLNELLNDYFHTICEDGSTREVATLVVTMYQQCAAGNLSLAQQVLSVPVPTMKASEMCQAAPEPEEFDGDMADDGEGDDDDMGTNSTSTFASSSSSSESGASSGFGGYGVSGGGGMSDGGFSVGHTIMEDGSASAPLPFGAPAVVGAPVDPDGWSTVGKKSGRKPRS